MQNLNAKLNWFVAATAAIACIGLNTVAIIFYLATFFNWNLTVEKIVNADELMDPVPLFLMLGCAGVILIAMILNMLGVRFEEAQAWATKLVGYLSLFAVIFYFGTAIFYPQHPLRFEGRSIEVNDGKWMEIKPAEAESIFRQNIRRNIGSFVFCQNVAISGFFYMLFTKSTKKSNSSLPQIIKR